MNVEESLAQAGAILTNSHFVYTSGKHGANYIAKDALYTNPRRTSDVCNHLATEIIRYCNRVLGINRVTVVSPVVGGVALSQWVTLHLLKRGFIAFATFADKDQVAFALSENEMIKIDGEWQKIPKGATLLLDTGSFIIKRGYGKFISSKDVVVVEDVLTTGKSAKATVEAVKKAGGKVVMTLAICNRGGVTAEMLVSPYLFSAMNVNFETYDADVCPLCTANVPINTEFGHGKTFLKKVAK